MLKEFKEIIICEFEITDMSYYLDIEVSQSDKCVFICQKNYAREIFEKSSRWRIRNQWILQFKQV